MSEKLKGKSKEEREKELTIEQEIDKYYEEIIAWSPDKKKAKKLVGVIKKLYKKDRFDESNKIDNRTPRQIFEKAKEEYTHALDTFDDKNLEMGAVEKWRGKIKGIDKILGSMEMKDKK